MDVVLRDVAVRRVETLEAELLKAQVAEQRDLHEAINNKVPLSGPYWEERYRIERKLRVARAVLQALS